MTYPGFLWAPFLSRLILNKIVLANRIGDLTYQNPMTKLQADAQIDSVL